MLDLDTSVLSFKPVSKEETVNPFCIDPPALFGGVSGAIRCTGTLTHEIEFGRFGELGEMTQSFRTVKLNNIKNIAQRSE